MQSVVMTSSESNVDEQVGSKFQRPKVFYISSIKMSLETPAASMHSYTEIEEIILPEEVWIEIWSYLDFKTIQKICTRVSKSWIKMIRSSKLSWEMKLRYRSYPHMLEVKDFNAILFQWHEIRELHFSSEHDFDKFRLGLNYNNNKSLKKIVIPCTIELYFNPISWGWVPLYWIDPKHLLTPGNEIKNAIELHVQFDDDKGIPEEFAMRHNDCDFTNIETLEICESYDDGISSRNVIPMLLRFKKLKKLEIRHQEINIDYFLDILSFLGSMKTLSIFVNLKVMNNLNEEATKDIFTKALDITEQKFPFPDVRILKLEIFEDNFNKSIPRYSIIYGESGPQLTRFDAISDSESDASYSMDESVESSDNEDMNAQE